MTEPEVQFPVKCPICAQQTLAGFRISVVADALSTGEIRLYSNCHVASWHASEAELEEMRGYLDTEWGADLQEACQEFFSLDDKSPGGDGMMIFAGEMDAA